MKFATGTTKVQNYEQGYDGNLSQAVKDECKAFSQGYFRECNKGFGKKAEDIKFINQKVQNIYDALKESGDNKADFIGYLEFLILSKGNYEFMIPYYKDCHESGAMPKDSIEVHHKHTFGLMGTVDDILSSAGE